jgi:hypothetical protein
MGVSGWGRPQNREEVPYLEQHFIHPETHLYIRNAQLFSWFLP